MSRSLVGKLLLVLVGRYWVNRGIKMENLDLVPWGFRNGQYPYFPTTIMMNPTASSECSISYYWVNGIDARPIRFPLSVFVVSDMLELAQAHASYRFSIADESTNQIKLLIWLFNPSVRISYRRVMSYNPSPTHRRRSMVSIKSRRSSTTSIGSTGIQVMGPESKRTSKIMYKILGDGDSYVPSSFFFIGESWW